MTERGSRESRQHHLITRQLQLTWAHGGDGGPTGLEELGIRREQAIGSRSRIPNWERVLPTCGKLIR